MAVPGRRVRTAAGIRWSNECTAVRTVGLHLDVHCCARSDQLEHLLEEWHPVPTTKARGAQVRQRQIADRGRAACRLQRQDRVMVCHDVAVDRAMYVELDAVNPLLEGPGEGGRVFSRHSRAEPRWAMMSSICLSALPVTFWPTDPQLGASPRPRCGAGARPVHGAPPP